MPPLLETRLQRVAIAAIIGLGPVLIGTSAEAPVVASATPPTTSATQMPSPYELHFRNQFGLNSMPSYVATVDGSSNARRFDGVLVTPSEASELSVRQQIEALLGRRGAGPENKTGSGSFRAYLDSHSDEFAGFYFDQAGGGLVRVFFTGHLSRHESELSPLFPFPGRLVVAHADHSWQELTTAMNVVNAKRDELARSGLTLNFVGLSPMTNTVEVGVAPLNAKTRDIASHLLQGLPITLEARTPTVATGEQEVDAPPLRGGQYITHDNGNGYETACTSAFVVQANGGTYYVATAGHCADIGSYWNQGDSCLLCFGSYGIGNTTDSAFGAGNNDAAVIKLQDQTANSHQIFSTQQSCGFFCTTNVYLNVGVVEYSPFVGESACLAGSTSGGEKCTTIQSVNICLNESDNGNLYYLCHQDMTGYQSLPGDSGGSWYSPRNGTNYYAALGINSGGGGGQSNYTEINPALSYFGLGLQVVTGS